MFMHVGVFLSEVLHDQGGLFFAMFLNTSCSLDFLYQVNRYVMYWFIRDKVPLGILHFMHQNLQITLIATTCYSVMRLIRLILS